MKFRSIIAAIAIASSSASFAASDGDLDADSSSGNFQVQLSLGSLVRVHDMKDINLTLGGQSEDGYTTGESDFKITTNSNDIILSVSSSGAAGSFQPVMTNASGSTIPYSITMFDTNMKQVIGGSDITTKQPRTYMGTITTKVRLLSPDSALAEFAEGNYIDTVTVTVSAA